MLSDDSISGKSFSSVPAISLWKQLVTCKMLRGTFSLFRLYFLWLVIVEGKRLLQTVSIISIYLGEELRTVIIVIMFNIRNSCLSLSA